MTPTIIDPSPYCKFEKSQIIGINRSYVDGLLHKGTRESRSQADATIEGLETAGNEQPSFTFAGVHITEQQDMLYIDQDFYLNEIEQTLNEVELSKLAFMRMWSAWLTNTRPDLDVRFRKYHE